MKPITVVGFGPLPFQPDRKHAAAGLRAWQFASALAAAGHAVDLLLFGDTPPPEPPAGARGIAFRALAPGGIEERSARALRERIGDPAALVGSSTYASYLGARSGHPAPLWVDLHGDPIAEAQALAGTGAVARDPFEAHWLLAWCLRRGDRFSAVSEAQRFAVLGQLGAAGRLSRATIDTPLVAVLPDAYDGPIDDQSPERPIEPSDPFVIHVSGSFNSWVDGDALAVAIRLALAEESRLEFLVTGGAVAGYVEEPWRRFAAEIEALPEPLRRRVSLLGWIASNELERLERGVSCGVVPERPSVERELGSQNRGLRWMARGLPVVTTALSELGRTIERRELGLVYPPGDARSLADALLRLARDPALARRLGANARDWLRAERSIAATTAPLVAWAADPRPAPDRAALEPVVRRLAQIPLDQLHLEQTGSDDDSER